MPGLTRATKNILVGFSIISHTFSECKVAKNFLRQCDYSKFRSYILLLKASTSKVMVFMFIKEVYGSNC